MVDIVSGRENEVLCFPYVKLTELLLMVLRWIPRLMVDPPLARLALSISPQILIRRRMGKNNNFNNNNKKIVSQRSTFFTESCLGAVRF